ncbi:MAG: methionine--tRNA ligase subunit beta, partial [bacterium]
ALEELWNFVRRSNKYIDQTQPWILGRDEDKKDRLSTVLYNLLEALRIIAGLLKPFMINTPYEMAKQMGIKGKIENTSWKDLQSWGELPAGIRVKKGDPLYPRIDMEEYFSRKDEELDEESDETVDQDEIEEKDEKKEKGGEGIMISFDDFQELDLRVAEIISAEKITDSEKLLKLMIDLGSEERQLVAGIAKHYQPDELPGKKIIVVANMEPAEIFGVKSNGMLLAASNDEGDLSLATIEEDIAPGSKVK